MTLGKDTKAQLLPSRKRVITQSGSNPEQNLSNKRRPQEKLHALLRIVHIHGGGEVRPAREDANVEHEPEGDGREGCPALECRVDNVEWSY